jgi:hypothetical protein
MLRVDGRWQSSYIMSSLFAASRSPLGRLKYVSSTAHSGWSFLGSSNDFQFLVLPFYQGVQLSKDIQRIHQECWGFHSNFLIEIFKSKADIVKDYVCTLQLLVKWSSNHKKLVSISIIIVAELFVCMFEWKRGPTLVTCSLQ